MQGKKFKAAVVSSIVSLLFFLALRSVVYGSAYGSLAMMLGLNTMENLPLVLGALLTTSGILFANVYQIMIGRVSLRFVRIEAVLYFMALLAVVMLKSRGIQEINLDFLDFYRQIIEYPASVVINLILFIPAGAIVYKFIKSTPKAIAIALIGLVLLEALQYFLKLGIADVVDVAIDLLGFIIGYLTVSLLHDAGLRSYIEDEQHISLGFRKTSSSTNLDARGNNGATTKLSFLKLAATAVFFVSISVALILGFRNYEYEEYLPFENTLAPTSDETLVNLPTSTFEPEEISAIINSMNRFRLNEAESSSGWISFSEEGYLKSEGRIANYQAWTIGDEDKYYGLTLGVRENLEGVVITHGIPLITMPNTKIMVDGKEIDTESFASDVLPKYFTYSLAAEYSLQDGWFRAEYLYFSTHEDDSSYYAWIDYSNFTAASNNAGEGIDDYWLNIPTQAIVPVEGYVDILHENIDSGNYFTMRINDRIGNAMICHTIDVKFDGTIPASYVENVSTTDNKLSFMASVKKETIMYSE